MYAKRKARPSPGTRPLPAPPPKSGSTLEKAAASREETVIAMHEMMSIMCTAGKKKANFTPEHPC
jgi:hypothetical protein